MDLFGNLPAAKNSKQSTGSGGIGGSDDLFGGLPAASGTAATTASPNDGGNGDDGANAADSSKRKLEGGEGGELAQPTPSGASARGTSGTSLVSALGTAGTSMAFVPAAIAQARKKKKLSQQQQQKKPETIQKSEKLEQKETPATDRIEKKHQNQQKDQDENDVPISIPTSDPDTKKSNQFDPSVNPAPENTNDIKDGTATTHTNDEGTEPNEEPYLENEPESLRLLHASVHSLPPTQIYDPHFPNDYLAYRERKKTEQVRKDLQKSALERLDAQEKLRKKIEEERRKIEESGDLSKIVESRGGVGGLGDSDSNKAVGETVGVGRGAGRGAGRGRGLSNLPAWLIKKQKEEQEAKEAAAAAATPSGETNAEVVGATAQAGQFDDAQQQPQQIPQQIPQPPQHSVAQMNKNNTNCTVTLLNMVAPGEIDADLSLEVQEECEEQCGKVIHVQVTDATSSEGMVRVDVTFEREESARDAVRVFDGRMFGSRRVMARLANS